MTGEPSASRPRIRWLRPLLSWLGLALAAGFIIHTLRRDLAEMGPIAVNVPRLAIATACFVPVYAAFGWGWHLCLTGLGGRVHIASSLKHWYLGNLMKYLPGKLFTFAARLERFQRFGVPMRVTTAAFAAETILLLSSGVILLALVLPFSGLSITTPLLAIGGAVSLPALLLLHPRVFRTIADRMQRRLGRDPVPMAMTFPQLARALGVFLLGWFLTGLCFAGVCSAMAPCERGYGPGVVLGLAGLNSFTWVVGMAAPVVPAGLGVKEGLLRTMTAGYFPEAAAGVIAVAARVWMTAGDVLGAGCATLLELVVEGRGDR